MKCFRHIKCYNLHIKKSPHRPPSATSPSFLISLCHWFLLLVWGTEKLWFRSRNQGQKHSVIVTLWDVVDPWLPSHTWRKNSRDMRNLELMSDGYHNDRIPCSGAHVQVPMWTPTVTIVRKDTTRHTKLLVRLITVAIAALLFTQNAV